MRCDGDNFRLHLHKNSFHILMEIKWLGLFRPPFSGNLIQPEFRDILRGLCSTFTFGHRHLRRKKLTETQALRKPSVPVSPMMLFVRSAQLNYNQNLWSNRKGLVGIQIQVLASLGKECSGCILHGRRAFHDLQYS